MTVISNLMNLLLLLISVLFAVKGADSRLLRCILFLEHKQDLAENEWI